MSRRRARRPIPEPCAPVGSLTAPPIDAERACRVCGATLHRTWQLDGMDFAWLDADGHLIGGTPPAGYAENPKAWWGGLRARVTAGDEAAGNFYSTLSVALDLGGLAPWEHGHQPADPARSRPRVKVPECHDWPMRAVRDGWVCRRHNTRRVHPYAAEEAPA